MRLFEYSSVVAPTQFPLKVVSDSLSRTYGTSFYTTKNDEFTGIVPDTVHICGQILCWKIPKEIYISPQTN